MIYKKTICFLLIVSAQSACQVSAQPIEEAQRPSEVVATYLQARQSEDWKAAARSIYPDHISKLYPYVVTMFKDEGPNKNIFRKYFVGPDVTTDTLLSISKSELIGDYLAVLHLTRSGRAGLTEFLGFEILNSFMEAPDLANVVVRERARIRGEEYQTSSVVRLKRIEDRWFVLVDDEVFQTKVAAAGVQRIKEKRPYNLLSVDFRALTHNQRSIAFKAAARRLMRESDTKYEFVVGKDADLSSELRQLASVLNVQYRIEFVESPTH
ncbi:hypothetical protein [Pseudoduganella sp. HUAS MS19]